MADEGRLPIDWPGGKKRDSLRSYEIRVDGIPVGNFAPGSTADLPVVAGSRQVSAQIDWSSKSTPTVPNKLTAPLPHGLEWPLGGITP